MNRYDELFEDVAAADGVFVDKGALDPLAEPEEVVARDDPERALATTASIDEPRVPRSPGVGPPPGRIVETVCSLGALCPRTVNADLALGREGAPPRGRTDDLPLVKPKEVRWS